MKVFFTDLKLFSQFWSNLAQTNATKFKVTYPFLCHQITVQLLSCRSNGKSIIFWSVKKKLVWQLKSILMSALTLWSIFLFLRVESIIMCFQCCPIRGEMFCALVNLDLNIWMSLWQPILETAHDAQTRNGRSSLLSHIFWSEDLTIHAREFFNFAFKSKDEISGDQVKWTVTLRLSWSLLLLGPAICPELNHLIQHYQYTTAPFTWKTNSGRHSWCLLECLQCLMFLCEIAKHTKVSVLKGAIYQTVLAVLHAVIKQVRGSEFLCIR